jgi:hypothetical protein
MSNHLFKDKKLAWSVFSDKNKMFAYLKYKEKLVNHRLENWTYKCGIKNKSDTQIDRLFENKEMNIEYETVAWIQKSFTDIVQ